MPSPEHTTAPSPEKDLWQELQRDDLQGYSDELKAALNVVSSSPTFRTSPKSREFLQHIVFHTLEGDVDSLKERLIGMELLGRDASYDTSTDAGVRVRANDVRKRLTACNQQLAGEVDFFFTLPAGSYVPVFFKRRKELPQPVTESPALSVAPVTGAMNATDALEPPPPLSLGRLALPTMVALFLCIICMRWQVAQENSFANFWQHVFQGDQAQLYLPPSRAEAGQDLVAVPEVKAAAQLLDVAAQFHHRFTLSSGTSQAPPANAALIYIENTAGNGVARASALGDALIPPDSIVTGAANRFVAEDTSIGRVIFDRKAPNERQPFSNRAALLTIVDGTRPVIVIDGTDEAAIAMLVHRLCDQNVFPGGIADSLQPHTMTQAVFPVDSRAAITIVHEPLPGVQARLEPWQ